MHGVATPGEQGHEAQTQRAARAYVVALHGAVRAENGRPKLMDQELVGGEISFGHV